MGVQGGYAKSVESFGYATEMNPKLKGKKTPLLPPEPTEEYIPPAFNASEVRSPWAAVPLLTPSMLVCTAIWPETACCSIIIPNCLAPKARCQGV